MWLVRLACLMIGSLAVGQVKDPAFQVARASTGVSITATATQAVVQYTSPVRQACSLKVADMNRGIKLVGATQSGGVVTAMTSAPHGLLAGAVIYLEGTGVAAWNGWRTVSAVADATHFAFANATSGTATAGTVGVLVDDVNPSLFTDADLDSRAADPNDGYSRVFVVGKRAAETGVDGNRYTRALQVSSRHHLTLTCGTSSYSQDFTTQNLAAGNTYNEGAPADRNNAGQYAYPTVQWGNRAQTLIDPLTGVRSVRITVPSGAAAGVQTFATALDKDSAWTNRSGPLSPGGTATNTGPCASGTCALFLRADNLSLGGGASYTTGYGEGVELDWISLNISGASINNSSCTASSTSDSCKIAVCLTVDGLSCVSSERNVQFTSSAATYAVGATTGIDYWQDRGAPAFSRPDISRASGVANYTSATRTLAWASGNRFNIKWKHGSRITVAGAEYTIDAVQNELALTLVAPGPAGNLSGVSYAANNFGVLIRKKTSSSDKVSIGYTTFTYGTTPTPTWSAGTVGSCSAAVVKVNGVDGYNCFSAQELYWIAADGSDVRDLGSAHLAQWTDMRWSTDSYCGDGASASEFDPLDGDTWYCMLTLYPHTEPRDGILKAQYQGSHTAYTPGAWIPDCGLNKGVQPCIAWTIMQPNVSDAVGAAGGAFNPDYAASGYKAAAYQWNGVSPEGEIFINTREPTGQDSKGWAFVFTLGNRLPAGTTSNSLRPVAAASSYRQPPITWCTIHATGVPSAGWVSLSSNDMSVKGASATYVMTLKSTALNATVGATGGLNTCPTNSYGATGQRCTDITVSGTPTLVQDGSTLQEVQVGDIMVIDREYVRVLAKADATHLTVQRGYVNDAASHSSTTLTMACGAQNTLGAREWVWNFRDDPYGKNAGGSTLVVDQVTVGGHAANGAGVQVNAAGAWYRMGEAACPRALLGNDGMCYQVRRGTLGAIATAPGFGIAENPPFAGSLGIGNPNQVDAHPGPCFASWCLDARPMLGGTQGNVLGSSSSPWVNVTGQLWKYSGGASSLHRKQQATMAYNGRSVLVDISGPGSVLASDSTASYRYCVSNLAGECRSGSSAGDVYVNSPFVSQAYCYYTGIAAQDDDTNSICVGPLGAFTGNLVQFGTAGQDSTGASQRRLGTAFSRWNQQSVFWNMSSNGGGSVAFSQARWLDGIRHENLITKLPAFPNSDSVARNTFVPVQVSIPAKAGSTGRYIVVEFGYAENGSPDGFYCTSRQEACVATSSTIDQTTPFHFEQTESYAGVSCDSGCKVVIPALSQRVLYYRWQERTAAGVVTAVSTTRVALVP